MTIAVIMLGADRMPQGWLIYSDDDRPEIERVNVLVSTAGPGSRIPGFGYTEPTMLCAPGNFDPARDGWKLIDAQRRDLLLNGVRTVGGFAELAKVDRDGRLSIERVGRWKDRIGVPITLRRAKWRPPLVLQRRIAIGLGALALIWEASLRV